MMLTVKLFFRSTPSSGEQPVQGAQPEDGQQGLDGTADSGVGQTIETRMGAEPLVQSLKDELFIDRNQ